MQSRLEWGQEKFIKFEMKKGRSKEENKLKQDFPNSIESRFLIMRSAIELALPVVLLNFPVERSLPCSSVL